MWIKSQNDRDMMPAEKEKHGNSVILRKNYRHVAADGEMPAHYEYDEWQMTKEQYDVYLDLETRMHEQDDALVELAGLISEVI